MAIWNALRALENVLKVITVTEGVASLTESDDSKARVSGEELEMGDENKSGTFAEEIELEARYLVKRVRELLHEGNIRKLIIKDSKGKYLLEIPLTMGVVAGGVFVLYAPVMTALSVIAGAVTNVRIEVVRSDAPDKTEDDSQDE